MSSLDDLPAVNTVAVVLSLTLWSFYVCLFTVFALRKWRMWSLTSLPVVFTLLIFACNLGDTICTIVVAYRGFGWYPEGKTIYFIRFYSRLIDHGWFAAGSFFHCSAAFLADLMMIWRVYVVWSRNVRVLYIPIVLMSCASTGCAWIFIQDVVEAPKFHADPALVNEYNYLSAAVLALDILMTWYYTIMICYRLWAMERQNRAAADAARFEPMGLSSDDPTSPYAKIIRVLIQSGIIFSITEIVFLVCVLVDSTNGKYIMNYLISRMIGISTVLIVLQLNNGGTSRNTSRNRPQGGMTGASETFSMPVFRVSMNAKETGINDDPEVGAKNLSQSSAYDNSTGEDLSYSSTT
ncbi:hypothetical protein FRB96_005525 [Tulasnella sp. 330]|nr:hypothetical protein FRB96_005525 [Tulasnella sp. 330]KAG8887901.1 hypothetical protein FRB98_008796 [Tulasnella sp. 332]